jgi:hypothetical protein
MAAHRNFGSGRRRRRFRRPVGARGAVVAGWLVVGVAVLSLLAGGCRSRSRSEAPVPPPSRALSEVLAAHTPALMALPGVVGTAESKLDDGRPCVLILVSRMTPELRGKLPRDLEGWPVKVQVTGDIHALPDSTP